MKRAILALALLVAAVASAQNAAQTIVQRALLLPLIPDWKCDVAHVVWKDGVGIRDLRGNTWTPTGTVPIIGRTSSRPTGAGPFSSGAAYWSIAAPNVISSLAGSDFSVCAILWRNSIGGGPVITSGGTSDANDGFNIILSGDALYLQARTINYMASAFGTGSEGDIPHVLCAGAAGGNLVVKADGKAATSTAGTLIANAVSPTYLGVRPVLGNAVDGAYYELCVSHTSASDGFFSPIMTDVRTRLGITAW